MIAVVLLADTARRTVKKRKQGESSMPAESHRQVAEDIERTKGDGHVHWTSIR